LILRAAPEADPPLEAPPWWGRASHALALAAIGRDDPALAAVLHEGDGPRPFTASSLMGRFPGRRVDPAEAYTLRLTAIQAAPAAALLRATTSGGALAPGGPVDLDHHLFRVETAHLAAEAHPWAGAAGYAELAAARLVGPEPPPRQISFIFTSPTAFRSQERHIPVPLPDLTFGSLLDRWNAFSSIAFPAETKRYAAECLAISRYELATRPVQGKEGGLRVGAVGRITFTALNYDRYWMSVLGALAGFALYAGAGIQTTAGLGQCRQMVDDW